MMNKIIKILKKYIFMIWRHTQIKMIILKCTPADIAVYNNLIEILKEIKTH